MYLCYFWVVKLCKIHRYWYFLQKLSKLIGLRKITITGINHVVWHNSKVLNKQISVKHSAILYNMITVSEVPLQDTW